MLTFTSRRRRALTAAALAATVALAACNSDSGSTATTPGPGSSSVLSKAAAATAQGEGTATGHMDFGGERSTYSVKWQGDFAHGRGIATGHLPSASKPALTARWTGGQIYVRRTATPADFGTSPLGQIVALEPGAALWASVPAGNLVAQVFAPISPPDLVRALANTGKQTVSDGPKVGGVQTKKVVVTGQTGIIFNWIGPKSAEVLLDGQNRARRITVTYGNEQVRLDVRYTSVAPQVTPPSAKELAAKTPEAVTPIGPYQTVRTGTTQGVAWTLQKAPGRRNSTCWRWSSTPPLAVVQPNYLSDTRCLANPSADDDLSDQIEFVLWTDGTQADTAAVVAVVPPGLTQATLGFIGGTSAPATIDGGLLVWVGPSSASPGYVGFPSGDTTISCGVGAVSSIGDLSNEALVGDVFKAPWICQTD